MRVIPKTEREIAEAGLWEPGTYDFEVLEADDTVSKSSGAEMIKLKVKIFNDQGESQIVFDYLLDSMAGKLRHAAEAFGLLAEYERGGMQGIDCQGKTGRCKVSIQKDKTGQYPDKNGIADYIPAAREAARPGGRTSGRPAPSWDAPKGVDLDDEIPF